MMVKVFAQFELEVLLCKLVGFSARTIGKDGGRGRVRLSLYAKRPTQGDTVPKSL